MRESDALAGSRKKRHGWRKRHFERLVRKQGASIMGSRTDLDALNDYAAASTSRHVLARGDEITNGVAGRWDAQRDPSATC